MQTENGTLKQMKLLNWVDYRLLQTNKRTSDDNIKKQFTCTTTLEQ